MTRFITRAALGLVLGSSALGLAACDFDAAKEAFENAKIVLGLEDQKTTVGVQFVDAATGQPLSGDFQVTFTGPDAATVVDAYGDPLEKRTARGGLTVFSIANTKTPTAASPVSVRLSATPQGYLPVAQNIVLSDTGAVSVRLAALRTSGSSVGTQSAQQTNTASAVGTTSPLNLTTSGTPPPSGGQPPPQASVSAPAGMTILSASNQALTGSVTTSIVTVDPTQAASLALLPSGLNGGAFGKNAAATNVPVASGNFSVVVDGVPAASVTAPAPGVTLQFNISPSFTTNPATGQAWTAGQTIPAYRYNGTSWAQDGTFTVVSLGNGQFAAQTQRTTLSTGWWAAVVQVQTSVNIALTINRSGQTGPLTATLAQPGFTRTVNLTAGQSSTTFTDVPTSALSRTISVAYGNGQSTSVNATSGTSFSVTLGTPPPTITVNVTPKCPDPNQGIYFATLPSIFVYASVSGQGNYFSIGDVSKQATITRAGNSTTGKITKVSFTTNLFEVGKSYDVIGSYEGNTFGPETRSVTGATMDLTWDVAGDYCQ